MPLKIVFMGSPGFAVPALDGLAKSNHDVVAVYSQPPRPAGRGHKLRPCPVHAASQDRGIPVYNPIHFKHPESITELQSHGADIAVVAAYGLLLPQGVLEAFPQGCINIHPSALPRWRGAAPIHRTVLAGDAQTAICIMQMDAGLDTGDVLLREDIPLPQTVTTGQLHDMLAERSVPLLLEALNRIEAGTSLPTPQGEDGVTYAKKISKAESQIDWSEPAETIERQIRGLNPYPTAVTSLNSEPIKIWEAEIARNGNTTRPGTALDDALAIACGENTTLRLLILQRPGKKPMPASEFLRGCPVPAGTMLGA